MKTTLKIFLNIFCVGVMILGRVDISVFAFQNNHRNTALPLKPTKKITFTTDEVTWMSLDVSPDGKTIVFELLGDLYTLPITGGKAERITSGMAFDSQPRYSPDGKRIVFVSDRSGSENLWFLEGGEKITDDTNPSKASGLEPLTEGKNTTYASPEWTPDGNYIVATKVSHSYWIDQEHSLWMYHVDGGSGVQLLVNNNEINGLGAAFGPDERYIYFANRRPQERGFAHQIEIYDRETGIVSRITNQVGGGIRPVLSSDGKWMVYGSRHDSETGYRLRNMKTDTEKWLAYPVQWDTQEGNWIGTSQDLMPGYSFSKDNSGIITSIDGKLCRVEIPSGEKTEIPLEVDVELEIAPLVHFNKRVPDGPMKVRQIRWPTISPDGNKLLFTAMHKLFVKDLASGRINRLVEMKDGQFAPSWSPDGKWIAFVAWSDYEGGHLYKVKSNGRGLKQLSQHNAYYTDPAWKPDGSEIIVVKGPWQQRSQSSTFNRIRGQGLVLVCISANGGEAVKIAPTRGIHPHFADKKDRIYVYERAAGLVSIRLDGTDRKVHLKAPGANEILMGPDGEQALVLTDYHIYRVVVPLTGGKPPIISVVNPRGAAFPVKKLSHLGGGFISWSSGGDEALWSLGTTVSRYNFVDAEGRDLYKPKKIVIQLNFPRLSGKGTLVLRGARLLTMESGSPSDGIIENGAIVITDNRIVEVGKNASIQTPHDAREIDVAGATILPGFIDVHAHMFPNKGVQQRMIWEYLSNLSYGVITTRDPQTSTIDYFTYSDLVETGEIVGPRIFSTGPGIFDNTNIRTLDDARNVAMRYAKYYHVPNIKQYLTGDRSARQLLSMAAREMELIPTSEGLDMKMMITHIFDGQSLEHNFPQAPLYKDMVELTAQSGTYYDPTLIVHGGSPRSEDYFYTNTEVHDDVKLQRFVPFYELDKVTRRRRWYYKDEYKFPLYAEQAKKIVEAGGRVCVGGHGQLQGLGYHWELWSIHSGGMSEMDALRCATLFGAEAIGFSTDLGSIKEGKLADLVVLNSNPLDNIRNTTDIRYVVKNGLLYDAETLEMLWPSEKKLPPLYWSDREPGLDKN